MTALLHKLIPEEIILRIFSFVSVVGMRNVVANHQLLRLFHDPQLWKRRVESLLLMCTPEARDEVERRLAGASRERSLLDKIRGVPPARASHLWSRQLQYDHDWLMRVQDLRKTSAEFSGYVTAPEYQRVYVKMEAFQMVSMRLPVRGDLLSTIPFIQAVLTPKRRWDPVTLSFKKTKRRESSNVLRVDFVPNKHFIASCTCVHAEYHVCVNGRRITDPVCWVRVGDTLQMVTNKSGKVREFQMQLDFDRYMF
jgi:hypothetical protein